jgi:ubiquinone/menaquinone biosynthesis C-methylase UbiE
MVWYSRVRKLRERERLLDLVPWRGDEQVLDVGCGRGLLLNAAARRLSSGRAVGVDLWQGADLSGNRPEATLENARKLPFADASFDVVVSCLALHNIYEKTEREQAVHELARVLRPGGHVVVLDIQHTADYARLLRESGLQGVTRSSLGFWTVLNLVLTWGAVRYYRVIGRKPAPPAPQA